LDGRWKTVASKTIVKDRWIDLRADQCITPTGQDIQPYYVLTYPDWINVVAITPDDHVLLVRQYRHAAGEMFWEIPGGAVDPADPDLRSTAARELEEETGYRAAKIELVASLFPNPASHTNRLHTFLATDAIPVGTQQLEAGEEGLSVHLVSVPELITRLQGGFLGQALHTSSVLMALMLSGRIGTTASK
jgi:8-oxo-dGTP pyrophosphatase MutT (NUDIX family)